MINEKKITPVFPLTEKEKAILETADARKNEIFELVTSLIKIDSRNYSDSEFSDRNEIFLFVKRFLKKNGFDSKLIKAPFAAEKKKSYSNLLSEFSGSKEGKKLLFCGHLDVVPYDEELWSKDTPPLGGVMKDGKIFGRGACDMKGGVACMIMAMIILKDSGFIPDGAIRLLLTPDEETQGRYGIKHMVENQRHEIYSDLTLIAEPTQQQPLSSPVIAYGEKGPRWIRLLFHGAPGHGSIPRKKSSALNKAARFINSSDRIHFPGVKKTQSAFDLYMMMKKRLGLTGILKLIFSKKEKDSVYDEDNRTSRMFTTTMTCNNIKAGESVNVIPEECELRADIRALPGLSTQDVLSSLSVYSAKLGYRMNLPRGFDNPAESKKRIIKRPVDIDLSIISEGDGTVSDYRSDEGNLVAGCFESVFKTHPVFLTVSGFTDGGFMRQNGFENVFVIGPGGENIHGADEYVLSDSLVDCVKYYMLLAMRFFSTGKE